MNWLTKTIALAVLALWGLATVHCDLEQLPGLEFLSCCDHSGTAPHQDNDCNEDACAVVESGFYQLEEQPASLPAPVLGLSFLQSFWAATPPVALPEDVVLILVPPELPRIWQFALRTALPPRAPSLAS